MFTGASRNGEPVRVRGTLRRELLGHSNRSNDLVGILRSVKTLFSRKYDALSGDRSNVSVLTFNSKVFALLTKKTFY
jgi:hypothetical protein